MVGEVIAHDVKVAAVAVGDALADDALVDGRGGAGSPDAGIDTIDDLGADQKAAVAVAIDADVVADAFDVDGDLFGVGDDAWGVPVGVHAHGIHVAVGGERGGSGEHEIARALELGGAGGFVGMACAGDGREFEGGGVRAFADQAEIAGSW